jgi:hypothetical protein
MRFIGEYPSVAKMPLPSAALLYLQHLAATTRVKSGWKPQTFFRQMCNLEGALSCLPVYSSSPHRLRLAESVMWTEARNHMKVRAMSNAPQHQSAASPADVRLAIDNEPNAVIKLAIQLQFATAQRIGDTLNLRKRDVEIVSREANGSARIRVTVMEGKGVAMRGTAYTADTVIEGPMLQLLEQRLAAIRPTDLVIAGPKLPLKARAGMVNRALKRASIGLTTRSLRRGALQAMATGQLTGTPVPLETLMRIAGHLNAETTRRYLDYGRLMAVERAQEIAAVANLRLPWGEVAAAGGPEAAAAPRGARGAAALVTPSL